MSPLPAGLTVRRVPFRDGSDADLAALHLVESQVERERRPDRTPQTLESYVAFARSFPTFYREWSYLVRAEDGVPVATLACWYHAGDDPRTLHCDVVVRRDWRRRGIGAHLLTLVCGIAEEEGRTLLFGGTHDTVPAGEAFALGVAARPGQVSRTSELRLSDVDWAMVDRWVDEAPERAPGYALQMIDGSYPPELYGDVVIFHEIMETAPRDDLEMEESTMTVDDVDQSDRALEDAGRGRWTIFVRDRDGSCVGGTDVTFEPWEPATVLQGDTGIHPDHRGHGLGKWVKARMLQRIRAELPHAERVRTGNAYSNAPMLAINDALGFKVIQSRTEWQIEVPTLHANLRQ